MSYRISHQATGVQSRLSWQSALDIDILNLMTWKTVITLLVIAAASLSGTVWYYGFEWSELATLSFYQNLANPSVRIVKVPEGLRKEEIADILAEKLGWDTEETVAFENARLATNITNPEGYYFPKTYMIPKDASPEEASKTMYGQYLKETAKIKKAKSSRVINEDTALKVASLIQREAAGKHDMALISGIIWNRVWDGMKLQVDATLQYAKGSEDNWWPPVRPADKKIESPYNTYKYAVPPTPIASPGRDAIEAAYNPQKTNCMFYLHDKNRKIHCSATYQGHLKNIEKYY